MTFTRNSANLTPIEDTVFAVVKMAKQDPSNEVINATIGTYCDEDGKLVAFDSVYAHYNEIDNKVKANYAESFNGNPSFLKQVYSWFVQDKELDLFHRVLATPGGTGAICTTMINILDNGETVILPDIAWGSYQLMASQYNLKTATYSLFEEDHFNLESFKKVCLNTLESQNKLLVVINDPLHNPTGYSLSDHEWKEIISFLNECSKKAPCVLLNDVAYLDYSFDLAHSRDYLMNFNNISENLLIAVSFSTSKSLTSYGLRCGAVILLGKDEEKVRDVEIVFEKTARAQWSNVPPAAMDNFTWVTTVNKDNFMKEKNEAIELIKLRAAIILQEAKECGLELYPFSEGFFITIKVEDSQILNKFHQALIDNHIYTVKVNKGIRLAICSLPINKAKGLAYKCKTILISLV